MSSTFEQLEDRRLFAVGPTDMVSIIPIYTLYSPITVNGTPYADNIYISNDGAGHIVVNNDGAVSTYSDAWTSSITVNADSGNDYVWTASNINHPMTIHGGYGNDYLIGGNMNDSIDGGGDTDTIYGQGGNDNLDGGVPGFAYYWDNTGNDYVNGGAGDDTINASDVGNCTLDGGDGNDHLYGWGGNDVLYGGWGNDDLHGGAGNDKLYGYTGNDQLFGDDGDDLVRGEWDNDSVCGGNGNDVLYGDSGDDYVWGENGDDKLYGGAGCDALMGGWGNDTLVNVGGGQNDCAWGEGGFDSFWTDSEATENIWDADYAEAVSGNVHRIGSFMTERFTNNSIWAWDWQYQTPGRDANGENFRDPNGGSNYVNYSNQPLFSTSGPIKDDIDQGGVGDCYFLATLSAVAKVDPNRIRQSVTELGDGTYAVRFYNGGSENYLRVDGDLPTNGTGGLSFAGLGTGGSNWVAIMEKAWAHFRGNQGSWQATASGWMDEAFSAVGASTATQNVDFWYKAFNNADNLWQYVCDRLSEGRAVTVGTHGSPTALVGGHAYMVENVYWSGSTRMVTLRNPWGYDGGPFATDGNTSDGYVHISAQQLYDSISKVQSAYV